MTSIPTIVDALQQAITTTATAHARSSGFCQRESKLDAATFCRGLILGWLDTPQASLSQLAQMVTTCGVTVSPQGLDQRFTPGAARLLQTILGTVATVAIPAATPVAIPLLQRFACIEVDDSSIVSLPNALATQWKGCGSSSRGGAAAVKLQLRLDLLWGTLAGPFLGDGKGPDKDAPMHDRPITPGSLRVADLSYFSLRYCQRRSEAGAYWLSRYHPQTVLRTSDGTRYRPADLPALLESQGRCPLDLPIELGDRARIPCRLLAVRVPEEVAQARRERLRKDAQRNGTQVSEVSLALAAWTIVVTNAPVSVAEALVLLRARWQIEQLFRRWKDQGKIDEWRSAKPWRILCELYAKLIGCILQHWLTVERLWDQAERSLTKAGQVVRDKAVLLAYAFPSRRALIRAIRTIHAVMAVGCRLNPRRRHPNTYQLLLDPSLFPLA
jgi:hypothetical protein